MVIFVSWMNPRAETALKVWLCVLSFEYQLMAYAYSVL